MTALKVRTSIIEIAYKTLSKDTLEMHIPSPTKQRRDVEQIRTKQTPHMQPQMPNKEELLQRYSLGTVSSLASSVCVCVCMCVCVCVCVYLVKGRGRVGRGLKLKQTSKRLPLETKNALRIRKYDSVLVRLLISSYEVCNTAYTK